MCRICIAVQIDGEWCSEQAFIPCLLIERVVLLQISSGERVEVESPDHELMIEIRASIGVQTAVC